MSALAYRPRSGAQMDDRFGQSVIISAIVHVMLIFGLNFTAANPDLFRSDKLPLEVVLVNAKSQGAPVKADVLAQVNLDGGGEVDEDRTAKSPLPVSPQDSMAADESPVATRKAVETDTRKLMTQAKAPYAVTTRTTPAEQPPAPPTPTPAPNDLATRALEMARLQAKIDADWEAYQKRPRKLRGGPRAQEVSFARYVEDWRLKVERVGNLNYPEAARRNQLYGSLILEVCIKPDGTLLNDPYDAAGNPAVVRSSGIKVLDAAAKRIVEMSAPFPPLSPGMLAMLDKNDLDAFCINRTWVFTREEQLTSR